MRIYRDVIFPKLNDWISRQFAQERKDLLSRALGDVLEIGFGSGTSASFYPSTIKSLTGLEPNPGMFGRAKTALNIKRSFQVELVQGSSESLPFSDMKFDCVVSVVTLCSVMDPKKTLSEIRRVLRKDGRLLFIEHGIQPDSGVIRAIQKAINPLWRKLACGCSLTRRPIDEMRAGGFEVQELKLIGRNGFPSPFGPIYFGVASFNGRR